VLADMIRLFEADWSGTTYVMDNGRQDESEAQSIGNEGEGTPTRSQSPLVVSPLNTREVVETTLQGATQSIDCYLQTVSDTRVHDILRERAQNKVRIRLLVGYDGKIVSNTDDISKLRSMNILVQAPKKPFVHAKGCLVDGTLGWV
jgi:phosphatidylserine/phosphatidylglycerophosphate/cardiolipin synthase-like enzyme